MEVNESLLGKLKFDEKGLIPAVVVDHTTKQVLTLAYMNRESLEISLTEGRTCFYSRSRQTLWRKEKPRAMCSASSASLPTATPTPWW